jgi:deazaflavin-dependent oxidoreductase (nitroreductase family)
MYRFIPKPLLRAGQQLAGTAPAAWYFVNVAPHIDRVLLRASGGRLNSTLVMPTLLLTTTGAKSGRPRSTPLIYFRDGERYVILGSNGGNPKHPAWYHNLRANPQVQVEAEGKPMTCRAEEAEGEERERLWQIATDFYAGFVAYQRRAGERRIPIILLSTSER